MHKSDSSLEFAVEARVAERDPVTPPPVLVHDRDVMPTPVPAPARERATLLGTPARPSRLRYLLRTLRRYPAHLREHITDSWNFIRWSGSVGERSARNLRGRITETFHNLEKGLSLPDPRLRFGAAAIERLLALCTEYIARHGRNERVLRSASDVLAEYRALHQRSHVSDYPFRAEIDAYIETMRGVGGECIGGLRHVTRAEIWEAVRPVGPEFFQSRHSVRQFSGQPVDIALIENAVQAALKSPAVCNRQYARAVVIADPALVAEVLARQGGARGFAEGIDKVIVVTVRLSHFWGPGERNQPWIDGGLFAMSLLLGLHSEGLGACCLNWSKTNAQTRAMQEFLHLDADEFIIMMIAVGHLREEFQVAFSSRIAAQDSMRVLTHWHR